MVRNMNWVSPAHAQREDGLHEQRVAVDGIVRNLRPIDRSHRTVYNPVTGFALLRTRRP